MATFGADVDPVVFRERIRPKLAGVEFAAIVEACGYSKGNIRAGKGTPHVSTKLEPAELAGVEVTQPR